MNERSELGARASNEHLLDEHGRPYHPDMELSWQTYLGNNGQQQPAEVRRAYIAAWYAAHAYAAGWPDRQSSETCDARDTLIAELTKWAADWAVYRGPAEKPVDKGWRLAAEEVRDIIAKSANTQKAGEQS